MYICPVITQSMIAAGMDVQAESLNRCDYRINNRLSPDREGSLKHLLSYLFFHYSHLPTMSASVVKIHL